jgi:hypothetical protein
MGSELATASILRLEQGLSGYRYLPTINAGGGGVWDPIIMLANADLGNSHGCLCGLPHALGEFR